MKKLILITIIGLLMFFTGCSGVDVAITEPTSLANAFNNITLKTNVTNPTYEDIALVQTDFVHWKTHIGDHYYIRDYTSLGGSSTVDILFITNNSDVHLLDGFKAASGAIEVILYDNVTVSANGTLINSSNSNFNYPNFNSVKAYLNPTVTTLGEVKSRDYTGEGQRTGEDNKRILKANSTYLFRINNIATTSNIIDYNFYWYDEK